MVGGEISINITYYSIDDYNHPEKNLRLGTKEKIFH